ncbi:MAG: acyl dehydratase [Acidimicrobiaceae bacterium]|jgi:hydroxyacyl-ACP dehydratase HTD2-like protein with hotdog domain|nr:acyl dehydratase [Acidimicrobiaceae bacterium]|tara:strand:- start:369 stop:791 length:423 start_codon:yes stop_codon:yes gene_type:complete
MTKYPTLASTNVGDQLPLMGKSANEAELFLYSAASFNPHRIHYDRAYAHHEGHQDTVVHGPLQGSWLTQFVTDWAGPNARLISIEWQNRASVFVDEEVQFSGTVVALDPLESIVELEIFEQKIDGTILMPAKAHVRLEER